MAQSETTDEPMITMRLSEWLRMDEEIKRLRADLAEVAVAIRSDAAHRATLAAMRAWRSRWPGQ